MPAETHSQFSARSYEIDSYGHLNNGVYVSWFEQGRLDYLVARGFSYDGFAAREQWFVVGRTEIDFRRAIGVGESIELTTRVAALGRSSVRFDQVMRRAEEGSDGAPVCVAQTVMVFAAHGASIPIPEDFRAAAEPA